MRISDLSKQSDVPVATIKFYLRERLLPPGTRTARNQAEYSDAHLARLRLVRILTSIGQLSLSSVREVLAAIEDRGLSIQGLCHVVNRALFEEQRASSDLGGVEGARGRVDIFIDKLGWQVDEKSPGRGTLAQVLAALQSLGWECDVDVFAPYAEAAHRLVVHEQDSVPPVPAATVVARTVLFEVALASLRRMAQEHHLAGADQPPHQGTGGPDAG